MTARLHDTPQPLLHALDAAVEGIVAVRKQIHALQAIETMLLASTGVIAEAITTHGNHTDHGVMAHRMVASEIGTAVHESDRVVTTRMWKAVTLTTDYPAVLASLREGKISLGHATVIIDAGAIIGDPAARDHYSAATLAYAEAESVGRLRPAAKDLAERFANRTIDERHDEARSCRTVRVLDRDDGMADLIATLPALLAYGIKDRLDQAAHLLKAVEHDRTVGTDKHGTEERSAGECPDGSTARNGYLGSDDEAENTQTAAPRVPRSVDQIRADILTDLLLTSDLSETARMESTGIASIQARVHLIIPKKRTRKSVRKALRAQEPAASLAGYGPIDTDTARRIAGAAPSWEKVSVRPETGQVISVDAYRPNAQLRRHLGARDLHCRFPGCRTPLRKCDIDHTVDAARGGPTSNTNLAHICRRHHTMKHATPWRVTQDDVGNLTWVSPTGRTHTDRPASRVRFRSTPGSGDNEAAEPATARRGHADAMPF